MNKAQSIISKKLSQKGRIDNSLAACWVLAEKLEDNPWGAYLSEWVKETRNKVEEASPPYVPITNLGEKGFVLLNKDFSLRVYDEQLEKLLQHKIYTKPEAAAALFAKKTEFLKYCHKAAEDLAWHQDKLKSRIERELESNPELLLYGKEDGNYVDFWVKRKTLLPAKINEWPSVATLMNAIIDIKNSYAHLDYYKNKIGYNKDSGGGDVALDSYQNLLSGIHKKIYSVLNEILNSLEFVEMPAELTKIVEQDKTRIQQGLADNYLRR